MLVKIHPANPEKRKIDQVVDCLQKGGVIIYPTDSVYAFACCITQKKAIEKICTLRNVKPDKANFSIACKDFSELSDYAKQINNSTFRLMKKVLPGPFTFILEASQKAPVTFRKSKKSIGIRVQDQNIATEIISGLGNPILTASLKSDDEIIEYLTDPELIHEKYADLVDLVIDGGYGNITATTVIDCTNDEPEIIRQGIGEITLP